MRILIVDDKKENLELAKKELGSIKGVELSRVSTFEGATHLLRDANLKFDAVFTDCMMPGEAVGIGSNNPEIGKNIPYGLIISIMAKNQGIEHVSIVTDLSNHHAGPIPWALDEISSTDTCVKCVRTKNWLEAYKNCFGEPEYEQKAEVLNKKLLILNRDFPISKSNFSLEGLDVVETSCDESDFLNQLVGDDNLTHVLIIGEMTEGDELKCFRKVRAVSKNKCKIIISGFGEKPKTDEFTDIVYVRLPFYHFDLRAAIIG